MLKTINGLPGNIIGIEVEGEVTGADYENVLIPAVDEKSKANKKIRLLYYLGVRLYRVQPEGYDK